jgi:hypothetical protein
MGHRKAKTRNAGALRVKDQSGYQDAKERN